MNLKRCFAVLALSKNIKYCVSNHTEEHLLFSFLSIIWAQYTTCLDFQHSTTLCNQTTANLLKWHKSKEGTHQGKKEKDNDRLFLLPGCQMLPSEAAGITEIWKKVLCQLQQQRDWSHSNLTHVDDLLGPTLNKLQGSCCKGACLTQTTIFKQTSVQLEHRINLQKELNLNISISISGFKSIIRIQWMRLVDVSLKWPRVFYVSCCG